MSSLSKKFVIETMSMNIRVPSQLHKDIAEINKQLDEHKLGLEIVLSKVVIKAMEEAKREGDRVLAAHKKRLEEAAAN